MENITKKQYKGKKLVRFIPALVMMMVIFCFSHMPGEESTEISELVTEGFRKILEVFQMRDNIDIMEGLHWMVRKAAHAMEYLVLAWTFLFAFSGLYESRSKTRNLTFLFCVAYAISDEVHQLFVVGRTAAVLDVGIDTLGVALGILLANQIVKIYKKRKGSL